MFVYLFGVRYDITPIVDYCKERKVDIVEDCAQSFCGVEKFTGHPQAILTMFSFGAIKIQTSIYAGIAVIRDEELHAVMKTNLEAQPLYPLKAFRKRIFAVLSLLYFINTRRGNLIFDQVAKLSGQEREEFYVSLSR